MHGRGSLAKSGRVRHKGDGVGYFGTLQRCRVAGSEHDDDLTGTGWIRRTGRQTAGLLTAGGETAGWRPGRRMTRPSRRSPARTPTSPTATATPAGRRTDPCHRPAG